MVIVASGVFMVAMGILGKVGAIFTTIPSPVMGGMFMVMFGVICAAGVSNLQVHALLISSILTQLHFLFLLLYAVFFSLWSHFQYTDMNSSRNIFIFGFSMFSGLVIPNWILNNPKAIATGALIKYLSNLYFS